jgi:DNA-binding XRE family transcriptional regulator
VSYEFGGKWEVSAMAMQGEEMKALRKAARMTQGELGLVIGMSGTSIGLMERGAAPIERRTEMAMTLLETRAEMLRFRNDILERIAAFDEESGGTTAGHRELAREMLARTEAAIEKGERDFFRPVSPA